MSDAVMSLMVVDPMFLTQTVTHLVFEDFYSLVAVCHWILTFAVDL